MDTISSWALVSLGALAIGGCFPMPGQMPPPQVDTCETHTIVDNGDHVYGYGTAVASGLHLDYQVGDGFMLATPARIQAVEFWGMGAGADFTVRIFMMVAGAPQESPLYEADLGIVRGTPTEMRGEFHYTSTLPEVTLPAGDYLLSIVNKDRAERWYWLASCEDGCEDHSFGRTSDADPWEVRNWAFAFRLSGCEVTSSCD